MPSLSHLCSGGPAYVKSYLFRSEKRFLGRADQERIDRDCRKMFTFSNSPLWCLKERD